MVTGYSHYVNEHVNQSLLIAEIYQHSITSTTLTWLRPPRPSHGLRCEIVWIYLVFCVLYVNQFLLIPEIYQHSITSTILTWLRPPRPSHGLRCEIDWIYLVFCAVCKSVFTDCRDIPTLYYLNHLDMVTTTTTKSWSPM